MIIKWISITLCFAILIAFAVVAFAQTKPTPTSEPKIENNIGSVLRSTSPSPLASPTYGPNPLEKELMEAKSEMAATKQALGLIQQQRNQLSAALLDAQAQGSIMNDMLASANKKIAELEAKSSPAPPPAPTPTKP
jgi:hypothetical protein